MGCSSSAPNDAGANGAEMSASRRRLSQAGGNQELSAAQEEKKAAAISNQDAKRRRLSVMEGGGLANIAALRQNADNDDISMPHTFKAQTTDSGDIEVAGLPIRYACLSRPGNDPMKRMKENQDSMTVIDHYGREDQMFIAVFDGHGPNGAQASQFVRSVLPQRVYCEELMSGEPFLPLRQGCVQTNKELSNSHIDVEVSGSTGIISFLRGNKLFVANVGDSRAVLGRVNDNGMIRAVDLSHDQKPDRPDEKARIVAHGGRVFEWGVPRVWLRDVDMPGLAMARSFGDAAAETVGVFAEPELSKVTLTSNHRFVIWASDGVWEFISSQEACSIVYKYWSQGPRKAADALVKESVKRWNLEEDVVDDTTVILLFLNYPKGYGSKKKKKRNGSTSNA